MPIHLHPVCRSLPWLFVAVSGPVLAAEVPLPPGVSDITAQRMDGHADREMRAEGSVVMRRDDMTLFADRLHYDLLSDRLTATGDVIVQQPDRELRGPRVSMQVEAQTGVFESPVYNFTYRAKPRPGRPVLRAATTGAGHAENLHFEGENQYRLEGATYTTCRPDNPSWYLQTDELKLDLDAERGSMKGGVLKLGEMPFLPLPPLSFPLGERRESGFLPATLGSSNNVGLDLTLPYYWNIAPNYDATLAPRLMGRRGVQFNAEGRYLFPAAVGTIRGGILPHDAVTQTTRSTYSWQHNQSLAPGLLGMINVNGASDDAYFRDLGTRLSMASTTHMVRQGVLHYQGSWWRSQLNVQGWQTLQDPKAPVDTPYARLPQLTFHALRPDVGGLDVALASEFVAFTHATKDEGRRLLLYPQVSMPIVRPDFYITPKVGMHLTQYDLTRRTSIGDDQVTRSLPVVSLDAGMAFERDVALGGRSWVQTLEPRFYYLHVPYRDQSNLPVFDTARFDVNFAQLFAENRYSGTDRFADAHQATVAAVSRLINPETGGELLRGVVGQRFHFSDQRVALPGEVLSQSRSSDTLLGITGQILPKTTLDSLLQYNLQDHSLRRFNTGVRYQPEYGQVFSASYRFTRDVQRDIDLATQWPLAGKLYGVARYNYSPRDKRLIESLAGVEYIGDCWALRGVMQRYASSTDTYTTAFFVQLELTGFAAVGSNPLNALRRGIPGYGRVTQAIADPVFGANYYE